MAFGPKEKQESGRRTSFTTHRKMAERPGHGRGATAEHQVEKK